MKTRLSPAPHDVYRNLHSKTWSLVDRARGLVTAHPQVVTITGATFVVQPAGNAKVRASKRKFVHAFVRGVEGSPSISVPPAGAEEITYNPYKHTTFVKARTGEPISAADVVTLLADGTAWAVNPR